MTTAVEISDVLAPPLSEAREHLMATDRTRSRLRQTLGEVRVLRQKLASRQQELNVMQTQLKFLTRANAQLKELAIRPEHIFACSESVSSLPRLTDSCLSGGLDAIAMTGLDQIQTERIRFKKGDQLYRAGDPFNALYLIRAGSCKTLLLAKDGRDQVAGFHMAGDVVGIDGIGTNTHKCQAVALESTEASVLPFDGLETFARRSGQFQRNLHKTLSDECVRAQDMMILLGTTHADQRLAVFLLDLAQRYQARGYSSCEFVLRMTRVEIGSYLGVKVETVSRTFSRFQHAGLITVSGRSVKLLDRINLAHLVDCSL